MPNRARAVWTTLLALSLALALPGSLRAEHGMPGYLFSPEDGTPLPLTGRVFVHNSNGVAWSLADLRAARPTLVGGGDRLPLTIVDSFDDMEGHTTPFESGAGYGESVIILAPERPLRPGASYVLRFAGEIARQGLGTREVARWTAATRPDREPPRWTAAPWFSEAAPNPDVDGAALIIPVAPEPGELWVEIRAEPVDKGTEKRMLVPVARRSGDETGCSEVYIWDHSHSVSGWRVHRDTARPFRLSFAAVDRAGNRSLAPGGQLAFVWPGQPLVVCLGDAAPPSKTAKKAAPVRWREAPRLSTLTATEPYAPAFRVHAPLRAPHGALFVVVEATPRKKGPTRRLVAALPPSSEGEPCAPLRYADGDPPETIGPDKTERFALRLAAIDRRGKRLAAPGAPLELPWTDRSLEVCVRPPSK